MPSKGKNIFAK